MNKNVITQIHNSRAATVENAAFLAIKAATGVKPKSPAVKRAAEKYAFRASKWGQDVADTMLRHTMPRLMRRAAKGTL